MTGNNTMTAEPGEELKINWTVKNDQGTAGLQMTFDFSGVTYSKAKKGSAYSGTPQFNAKEAATTGEINYAMADKDGQTAEDDAVIYTFTIKAPESGSATIGPKTGDNVNNKVVPTEDGKKHEFLFHGLTINVDKPTSSETTASSDTKPTSSETTASSDTKPTSSETTASSSDSKSETKTGTVLPGDVNCNGQVQINDVVLLNRYLAKTAEVSEQGLKNAECDGDGKIGQGDSSAIKEYLAKLIDVLPKK
ncbi:MAG: dockerin type I repeat-containing protein [Oscillospiraceae bacterium]|nr:dockerin type I repeat-containing protein [Oscillospiraceae bacterium]MBR5363860.1 dockerin type I repeat-containing protein [Oscillospiraceae bacterium]